VHDPRILNLSSPIKTQSFIDPSSHDRSRVHHLARSPGRSPPILSLYFFPSYLRTWASRHAFSKRRRMLSLPSTPRTRDSGTLSTAL